MYVCTLLVGIMGGVKMNGLIQLQNVVSDLDQYFLLELY